ncbi:MAG TPA: response regulator [Polyangiaceae bacterium]|jgi:two-component system chemotaxis response regulator CheY|nr:response regulator [Polyangiaceae bacterium]
MGRTVIVVDDSRTARTQVRNALSATGYQIVEAQNGRDCLAQLVDHPKTSLVICDVNMPVMDGLEMLQQMRTTGAKTPVLMLTTEAGPELQRRGRQAGVVGWIVKPFDPAALVRTVRTLLGDA